MFAQLQSSGPGLVILGKTAKPEELDLNRATSAPLFGVGGREPPVAGRTPLQAARY